MINGLLKSLAAMAALSALGALIPAHAQMMRHRPFQDPREAERGQMMQPVQVTPREMSSQAEAGPPGRMSPEERRQLRRDIHEAGRELYRREGPPRLP